MTFALHPVALAIPVSLHLGPFQLPIFGLMATAGLLAALALSQRTAAPAGLDPDRLWDTGIVAVLSAFLTSRLLLAAVNGRLFRAHPMLVLAQPSLTVGGLALTAILVGVWLGRHRLPLRRVLDAWAAPAALLAAILQLGHWLEGTDAGLPTTLPWALHTPSHRPFDRLHPVQFYAAAGYLVLCLWLLHRLRKQTWSPGTIAARALLAGGFLSFTLSFLRQPDQTAGTAWLDPTQWTALAAMLVGAGLWDSSHRPPRPGRFARATRILSRGKLRKCLKRNEMFLPDRYAVSARLERGENKPLSHSSSRTRYLTPGEAGRLVIIREPRFQGWSGEPYIRNRRENREL